MFCGDKQFENPVHEEALQEMLRNQQFNPYADASIVHAYKPTGWVQVLEAAA